MAGGKENFVMDRQHVGKWSVKQNKLVQRVAMDQKSLGKKSVTGCLNNYVAGC